MIVSVSNIGATIERLRKANLSSVNQVTKAMRNAAEFVFAESQRLVPKETFALMKSGRIEELYGANYTTSLEIIYGDESAPYALYVHEDPLKAHGVAFNSAYADEIAKGKYRLKEPQETYHFLLIPIEDLTAVKKAMWKSIL